MSAAFYKCYQSEKFFFSTGVSSFMLHVSSLCWLPHVYSEDWH